MHLLLLFSLLPLSLGSNFHVLNENPYYAAPEVTQIAHLSGSLPSTKFVLDIFAAPPSYYHLTTSTIPASAEVMGTIPAPNLKSTTWPQITPEELMKIEGPVVLLVTNDEPFARSKAAQQSRKVAKRRRRLDEETSYAYGEEDTSNSYSYGNNQESSYSVPSIFMIQYYNVVGFTFLLMAFCTFYCYLLMVDMPMIEDTLLFGDFTSLMGGANTKF
ncbi:hypothetical protein TrVE_jg1974 [Triparma verrucosa]|uniref:Uncharacterized protein n=1 Tax=Triparma verrucosa TaxID=1606542 RepID=A0A9W7BIM3_9STRA|nr:hypothetical protein TrVE_jg1974 [Triparma verrucosa]